MDLRDKILQVVDIFSSLLLSRIFFFFGRGGLVTVLLDLGDFLKFQNVLCLSSPHVSLKIYAVFYL